MRKGIPCSPETRTKISEALKGRKLSQSAIEKLKQRKGALAPSWKGGIYANNPAEYKRQYKKTHPNNGYHDPEYDHKYYLKNKEKIVLQDKERNEKRKQQIIERLGGKCANPYGLNHGDFLTDHRCLHIDHINSGGCIEQRKIGTYGIYRKIFSMSDKELKETYQLLCSNCNWIKRYEKGECKIGKWNNKKKKDHG